MTKAYSIELPSPYGAEPDLNKSNAPTDLKSLLGTVYRRFWLIALSFLAVFSIIAYMTFTQTPLYRASTTIQLDTTQQNVIDLGSVLGGIGSTTAVIDTEVRVISSKSLLTRVAEKENLIEDPEFNWALIERKPGFLDNAKAWIGGFLSSSDEASEPAAVPLSEEQRYEAALERAAMVLSWKTNVERIGTTLSDPCAGNVGFPRNSCASRECGR